MMDRSIFKYRCLLIVMMASLLALAGCDIHEYPKPMDTVEHEVQLQFNAKTMFDWEFSHDWNFEVEPSTKADTHTGRMRYIIRLYPLDSRGNILYKYVQEHILYGDINGVYGDSFTLSLLPGEYDIKVWADWEIPGRENEFFHDASDFSNITLTTHMGNTDHRDAFRGSERITVLSDMYEHEREPIVIHLERPFAKFEVITNDLSEFITKQLAILHAKEQAAAAGKNSETTSAEDTDTKADIPTKTINLDDYKVVIYYPGYMPSAYSIFSDKPVDAQVGNHFDSQITKLSATEATLGFDYVFVNGTEGVITIQIAIYNKNDDQVVSLSQSMNIPVSRNKRTIVKGAFMTQKASGGINIDTNFNGDIDINIPG